MVGLLSSLTWFPAAALALTPTSSVGADAPQIAAQPSAAPPIAAAQIASQQAAPIAAPVAAPIAAAPSVRERWWEPPVSDTPPLVELATLRKDGLRWLGRRARVVVQFDERVPTWDAWVSRFHPAAWTRVSAWGDEQFLWLHDEWERPWTQLYARSDSPAAALLANAARFRRYELEVEVREHLLGEARLEVLRATPLSESVGEGAILHASRALDLLDRGAAHLAKAEFERAQAGRLPAHARAELERLQASCDEF